MRVQYGFTSVILKEEGLLGRSKIHRIEGLYAPPFCGGDSLTIYVSVFSLRSNRLLTAFYFYVQVKTNLKF